MNRKEEKGDLRESSGPSRVLFGTRVLVLLWKALQQVPHTFTHTHTTAHTLSSPRDPETLGCVGSDRAQPRARARRSPACVSDRKSKGSFLALHILGGASPTSCPTPPLPALLSEAPAEPVCPPTPPIIPFAAAALSLFAAFHARRRRSTHARTHAAHPYGWDDASLRPTHTPSFLFLPRPSPPSPSLFPGRPRPLPPSPSLAKWRKNFGEGSPKIWREEGNLLRGSTHARPFARDTPTHPKALGPSRRSLRILAYSRARINPTTDPQASRVTRIAEANSIVQAVAILRTR